MNQATNSGSAYIAGFELAFQQHFTYLPGFLSGLGISANYSYATSQAKNVNPGFASITRRSYARPPTPGTSVRPMIADAFLCGGMAYNGANIFTYFFTACQNGEQVQSNGACVPNANDSHSRSHSRGVKGPRRRVPLLALPGRRPRQRLSRKGPYRDARV